MVAMHWVIPRKVGLVQKDGCKEIYSFSKHWPCVFPQHGSGPKHKRPIVLESWQRWVAVERHPEFLLRGNRAGIEWKQSYDWIISVARRDAVAKMDEFIGLKS